MANTRVHPRPQAGDKFGQLEVICEAESLRCERTKRTRKRWLCRCQCGTEKAVAEEKLLSGHTKSCGCNPWKALISSQATEYASWQHMLRRCYNPNDTQYRDYGERGITVCDRWRFGEDGKRPFLCFYDDMGPKPTPDHSIDRWPDNDAGYSPDNCRWATRSEQQSNRRNSQLLTFEGRTMTAQAWAKENGMWSATLMGRLNLGWPMEKALKTPIRFQKRRIVE